ncbi:HTH-like domain-containing protein [Rhizobium sp. NFR03]|nr:HTH-like domain-containing protein [Rhizobium sp. NFR03]
MISFIDEHRGVFGVEPICRLLPIALSTYYENVAKRLDVDRLSVRARSDIGLKIEIRRVFEQNFRVYGVRKVWRRLQREGVDAARCTVARPMRAMSLQGVIRGKPIRTTFSDKSAPSPLDRVNRQFKAPAPNRLWVSDFTYVATWQGFVYVATRQMLRICADVIDLFARRIVGWRASPMAHQALSSMPLSGHFRIGVPFMAAASCTT